MRSNRVRARERHDPDREHALRAVDERKPFLRAELERLEAGARQRAGRRFRTVAGQHPAEAEQRQREARERREVTRRAERPLLGHRRDQVAVQHLDHPLDHLDAHAGVAERKHMGAQREHRAGLGAREVGTDRGRVRRDDPALQCRGLGRVDPRVGERAEPGRDAVHRRAVGDGALDHVARSPDAAARAVAEGDLIAERHPLDVVER